jgi:hypothetical protein
MKRKQEADGINRRGFIQVMGIAGSTLIIPKLMAESRESSKLEITRMVGKIHSETVETPIKGATWYVAEEEGAGMAFQFPAGSLQDKKILTSDMLLDGNHLLVYSLELQEGEKGRKFRFIFGSLPQCSFRVRLFLELVDQRRWRMDREGAFLKPMCGGERVTLDHVDRMQFTILHKHPGPVRWCMTPLLAARGDVPKIEKLILPQGKLLDELGQSNLQSWPGRTRNLEELKNRIQSQFKNAPGLLWPEQFTQWGGWTGRKLTDGKGFFKTHYDGKRWWLVDPGGYAFWSTGLDCVRVDTDGRFDGLEPALTWLPDSKGEFKEAFHNEESERTSDQYINYLAANMIRALGAGGWREKWAKIVLAEMKRLRFNTVGNWSEWKFAKAAGFPYVRPLNFAARQCGWVYRDFPDVYHPGFESDAADFAKTLADTVDDPAFIGYFLMNEPSWGFSSELPAVGMLYNTSSCHTRQELAQFLRKKYRDEKALSASWKMPATFAKVESGPWQGIFTLEALRDLKDFTVLMVERYFQTISGACRRVDPNHLNLGMRWAGLPPEWAVKGMKFFDVFSLNCYKDKLPRQETEKIHELLKMPVMVGEYHFGALDAGLPASGIGHLKTQVDRGRAYRIYLEDAAANPYCVGAHWFTMYDQSAIGRFDGECYNIGFLDVCNRAYEEIGNAAIASHERMYRVAAGSEAAFADAPEYLPLLFL